MHFRIYTLKFRILCSILHPVCTFKLTKIICRHTALEKQGGERKKKIKERKRKLPDQQLHLGIIILSMAQIIWSQFLQNIARSVTAKKVQMIWKRLFIIGAMNFAIVETHTKMTVMKARITFMHFPRSTLALTVSDCCACCSCWWSSSFETRVWHDSKAS